MYVDGRPEARSRREVVANLLMFAKGLEEAGMISKASKCLLKELIVHENLQVISVGERLASSHGAQQHGAALEILEEQIKKRASKSHQELFEICPLEQAHLLSQQDTEALAEGSDVKSLVYGEIDFRSFYDVIRVAARGISTARYCDRHPTGTETSSHAVRRCEVPAEEEESAKGDGEGEDDRDRREEEEEEDDEEEEEEELGGGWEGGRGDDEKTQECEDVGERDDEEERVEGFQGSGARAGGAAEESGGEGEGGEGQRRGGGGRGGGGREGLKFYDLGSGSGKAVFAAVLAADFRCAVGIEVLAGVFRASTRVFKRYRKLVEPVLGSPASIELLHGSFLDRACDWSDGDLVFANSTCFAEDTMLAIAGRAELLRPGARVVTFTTALKTPWLKVLTKRRYQMSWGPATVFVHQKLSPDEFARRLAETTPFDEDQGMSQGTSTGGTRGSTDTMNVSDGIHKSHGLFSPLSLRGAAAEQPTLFAPAWSLPSETTRRARKTTGSDYDSDGDEDEDDSYEGNKVKHDDEGEGSEEGED
ncbi:unnamed protein product, partial [Hapterophycus canaliculatus]